VLVVIPGVRLAEAHHEFGVITTARGTGTLLRPAEPAERILRPEDKILSGDHITAGDNSMIVVRVRSTGGFMLFDRSAVSFSETPNGVSLVLSRGYLAYVAVPDRRRPDEVHEVRTANAIAHAQSGKDLTRVCVVEGMVKAGPIGATEIAALPNQCITVDGDALYLARPPGWTPYGDEFDVGWER
jgi:hypothetical protein